MNFETIQMDETMEMLKDVICTVAYDYVNNKSNDTDFFNKIRYLMHSYDAEAQRKAMLLYDLKRAEKCVIEEAN